MHDNSLVESLVLATFKGNLAEVEDLLNHGASLINAKYEGVSALHIAAQEGFIDIALLLLNKQADANSYDKFHQTPLWVAAMCGHEKIIEALIMFGANKNEYCKQVTPLWMGVQNHHLRVVNVLLDAQCDINLAHLSNGFTPLLKAITDNNTSMATDLIKAGADCNLISHDGLTPLMAAANQGDLSLITLLLQKSENIFSVDNLGRSALDYSKTVEVEQLLTSYGFMQKGAGPLSLSRRWIKFLDYIQQNSYRIIKTYCQMAFVLVTLFCKLCWL